MGKGRQVKQEKGKVQHQHVRSTYNVEDRKSHTHITWKKTGKVIHVASEY